LGFPFFNKQAAAPHNLCSLYRKSGFGGAAHRDIDLNAILQVMGIPGKIAWNTETRIMNLSHQVLKVFFHHHLLLKKIDLIVLL